MVLIKNSLCFNYVYDLMNVNYDDAMNENNDDTMNVNYDDAMNVNYDDLMNENEYTNMEYIYTFNEIKFKEENFLQYVKKNINEKYLIFVFNRL